MEKYKYLESKFDFIIVEGTDFSGEGTAIELHSNILIAKNLGYSLDQVNDILQKESGIFGLTEYSDLREIELAASDGNKKYQLAFEMNAYRINKYIGSFIDIVNGLDAIIFTAGIGENSSLMRKLICTELDFISILLDEKKTSADRMNRLIFKQVHQK